MRICEISVRRFFGMKKKQIYILVSGLGWGLVQRDNFLENLPNRCGVKTQLSCEVTSIPTILTGKTPRELRHFAFFSCDPKNSPFKKFRFLKYLFGAGLHKKCLFNRASTRKLISKITARFLDFKGRFNLGFLAYEKLPYFNYCENSDVFAERGLSPSENLCDILKKSNLKFHISDWRKSDVENLSSASVCAKNGADFIFVVLNEFNASARDNFANCSKMLKLCEEKILNFVADLKRNNVDFDITIISDYGISQPKTSVDLMKSVKSLGLKFGRDYVAFFDSGFVRFWYPDGAISARDKIHNVLTDEVGKFLSAEEKKIFDADFSAETCGEDIFLLNSGVQIFPCDTNTNPAGGVSVWSSENDDCFASFLSSKEFAFTPKDVCDFFSMMKADIENLM